MTRLFDLRLDVDLKDPRPAPEAEQREREKVDEASEAPAA